MTLLRVLRALMTNKLVEQLSLTGRNGKPAIIGMPAFDLVHRGFPIFPLCVEIQSCLDFLIVLDNLIR